MLKRLARFAAAFALAAACGCRSYEFNHEIVFADEDGAVVSVSYGLADKEHVNYFEVPTTKERMEFKSRLVVKVVLPDGDDFTAWQCLNRSLPGTLYRTDDDEWMFLANGFTCVIFHVRKDGRYSACFAGTICDAPKVEKREENTRWRRTREMKKDQYGKWK